MALIGYKMLERYKSRYHFFPTYYNDAHEDLKLPTTYIYTKFSQQWYKELLYNQGE